MANGAGKAAKETFEGIVERLAKGDGLLTSNKPITNIANNLFGAGEVAARVFKNEETLPGALRDTFKKNDKMLWGKVAGSYIGASAGMRVLGGGGITRDRNGNSNLIGVPFV